MIDLIETVVYAGRIKNKNVLLKSSSGGAFTALSDYFLNRGDAVVAAIYDYSLYETKFKLIQSIEERNKAYGSKYMQAVLENIFQECYSWLKNNPTKKIIFFGLGCQSDAFRRFAEIKNIRDRVYIVDIICHGVVSPKIWKEYALSLEKNYNGKIEYLTFKDKKNGWIVPRAYVKIKNNEISLGKYVQMFYNRCAMRPSCHKCHYSKISRKTDITIGDFWHIEETMPNFFDSKGTSLFLLHTNRGLELFDKIKDSLEYQESDTKKCWQINLEKPTKKSIWRNKFWTEYKNKGIQFVIEKYGNVSLITRLKYKIKKLF